MNKKLEKPFVYKREYDLTGYDVEILQKYELEQAIYVYVGSSCAYNMRARSSKWRYHIRTNNKSICCNIKNFIHNLELFYKMELKLSDNIINDKLYYSNIAEFEEFETLEKAREVESTIISQYQYIEKHKKKPIMRYHINCQFNTDGSVKSITQEFEPILELNKKNTLSRPSRVFLK